MGNACTNSQKTNITVPSRVIQVQKSVFRDKIDKNSKTNASATMNNNRAESSTRPSSDEENGKNDQQPSPEGDEEAKTSTDLKPFSFKYSASELGIGEYFLEKEFLEMELKSAELDKKNKPQDYSKWDNTLVKLRVKLTAGPQGDTLYNYVDLCFQNYAESNTKGYKKLIKKGIPARYRWSIWKNHAKLNQFYEKGLYEKLKGLSSRWEYDIKKDLHRTFPHEPYFSEKYEKIGQDHLFKVLKAVSLYLPNIGYAQSMNFIAAFLLLVNGGNEEEAFWTFISLARDHRFLLMGMFERDFPLLEFYTYIFYEILEEELPALFQHLRQNMIPDLLWLFKWFLTVFLYSFPAKQVIKIWDFIMTHGLFSMIEVAVGILKVLEADMLNLDTFGIDMLFKYLKIEPTVRAKSQVIPDNSDIDHLERSKTIQKKGTVIVNHLSQPDFENQNSIHQGHNETSEIQYSFKEFNINQALEFADKIHLTPEKISAYTSQYTAKTSKKLPSLYEKIFMDYSSHMDDPVKIAEFQSEVKYHLMRSELSVKEAPKKNKKTGHEVFVTFVDEADAEVVLIAGAEARAGASPSPSPMIVEPESASVRAESATVRGTEIVAEAEEFNVLRITTF